MTRRPAPTLTRTQQLADRAQFLAILAQAGSDLTTDDAKVRRDARAWIVSNDRRKPKWRGVVSRPALARQFTFAFVATSLGLTPSFRMQFIAGAEEWREAQRVARAS